MKKKYSDPMMFASSFLSDIGDLTPSQEGEYPPPDGDFDSRSAVFINSAFEAPTNEEPLSIVNPVEEASTSYTTENAGEAITTSPLKVESIIDEIVPEVAEEAATTGTTTY